MEYIENSGIYPDPGENPGIQEGDSGILESRRQFWPVADPSTVTDTIRVKTRRRKQYQRPRRVNRDGGGAKKQKEGLNKFQ